MRVAETKEVYLFAQNVAVDAFAYITERTRISTNATIGFVRGVGVKWI